MNYTKEQFDKLPKWAQNEIQRLEGDLIYHKKRAEQIEGAAETNTFIDKFEGVQPLPSNSRIKFQLQKGNVHIYINKYGQLDINSDALFGEKLLILPSASNSFFVTFGKL